MTARDKEHGPFPVYACGSCLSPAALSLSCLFLKILRLSLCNGCGNWERAWCVVSMYSWPAVHPCSPVTAESMTSSAHWSLNACLPGRINETHIYIRKLENQPAATTASPLFPLHINAVFFVLFQGKWAQWFQLCMYVCWHICKRSCDSLRLLTWPTFSNGFFFF